VRSFVLRAGRGDDKGLLSLIDIDLAIDAPVISADQADVERRALYLVRAYAIRAMDAWHRATAGLVLPNLVEPGEATGLPCAIRDQSTVASLLGLQTCEEG
jgi:uncharacterized protein